MREGDKREEVEANGLWGPKKRSVMLTFVLVLVSMFTFVCQVCLLLFVLVPVYSCLY